MNNMATTPNKDNHGLYSAAKKLRDAIRVEGPVPQYHHHVLRKHRKEWPRLWGAIDEILNSLQDMDQHTPSVAKKDYLEGDKYLGNLGNKDLEDLEGDDGASNDGVRDDGVRTTLRYEYDDDRYKHTVDKKPVDKNGDPTAKSRILDGLIRDFGKQKKGK
jgi:hypothetical protein